jgi:hypothetical protein
MPSINLESAVGRIYQIVDQRRRRKPPLRSPFFFIVGAGISNPPIPLAREIEIHCKQEAATYGEIASPGSDIAIDTYSYWFSKAYPSPEELQNYLRGLMEASRSPRPIFAWPILFLTAPSPGLFLPRTSTTCCPRRSNFSVNARWSATTLSPSDA